jgi:hypothetical protein
MKSDLNLPPNWWRCRRHVTSRRWQSRRCVRHLTSRPRTLYQRRPKINRLGKHQSSFKFWNFLSQTDKLKSAFKLLLASPGRKLLPILVYCIFKCNKLFFKLIKYNPFKSVTAFKLICVLKPDANPVVDSSTFLSTLAMFGSSIGASVFRRRSSSQTSVFATAMTLSNVDVVNSRSVIEIKWDITLVSLTKPN